jgi:hypothetical protein
MRNSFGLFAAIAVSVWFGAASASFVPRLTPAEQQRHQEMMKTDPSAARAYRYPQLRQYLPAST